MQGEGGGSQQWRRCRRLARPWHRRPRLSSHRAVQSDAGARPLPSSLEEEGRGFALPLPPRGRGIKGDGGPAANRTAMRRPVLRGRTFAASYQRGSDPKRLDGEWYSAHPPPRPSSPGEGGDGSPSPSRPAGGGSRGRVVRLRLRRRRATDRPAIPRRRRDDRRSVKRPANAGEAPPWGSCGPASPGTRSGGGLTPGQPPPPPPLPPPARGRGIKGEGGAPAPQARPRGQPAFIAPSTQGAEQRARRLTGAAEALPYASSGRGWQTARQRPACLRRGARIALHPDPTPSEREEGTSLVLPRCGKGLEGGGGAPAARAASDVAHCHRGTGFTSESALEGPCVRSWSPTNGSAPSTPTLLPRRGRRVLPSPSRPAGGGSRGRVSFGALDPPSAAQRLEAVLSAFERAFLHAWERGSPPIGDEARRHVETPARERRRFSGPPVATDEVGGVPPYSPALAPVGSIARDTGPSASGEPHGRNRRPEEAAAVRKAQLRPLSDSRRRCEGLAVRAAARRRGGTSAEERRSAPARTPIASALVNGSIRTCRGSRLHLSSIETSAVSTSSGPVSDAWRASSPMRGGPRKRKSHSQPGPPGRTGNRSRRPPAPRLRKVALKAQPLGRRGLSFLPARSRIPTARVADGTCSCHRSHPVRLQHPRAWLPPLGAPREGQPGVSGG